MIWPNNTIDQQCLQIMVLDKINAGLSEPDAFYFGNAIGKSRFGQFVDGIDFAGARDNPHEFLDRASITDAYDYNRDSFVGVTDLAIVRDHTPTS